MSDLSINNFGNIYNNSYYNSKKQAKISPKEKEALPQNISFTGFCIDSEEQAIMDKLLSYGCIPTGDKATDRAKLHRIELEKAKQDNYVSNKYLTVSSSECERIQERKKEKRKIANPEKKPKKQDERLGEKLRGEQIYLAIKMRGKRKD